MAFTPLAIGITYLLLLALGMLGNATIICHFILADTGNRAKPTDVIVKNLTWANLMVILFKGIPHTVAASGQISFLDHISCKFVSYFSRITRGVSLSSTSFLSVIQAITISPSYSKRAQLKVRAPKVIGQGLGLSWALHMLVNVFIPMTMTHILKARNLAGIRDYEYCAIELPHTIIILSSVLLTSNDAICLGFIIWASGSVVWILWKHRQRARHIHSSLCPRSSPEIRATKSILALVSSFVLFYVTSVILSMCFPYFDVTSRWLINANGAMTACFPAFCPFPLMRHYSTVPVLCCTCKTTHGPCTESSETYTMCTLSTHSSIKFYCLINLST